ncbi:MAG TPA: chemotaxis protein CheW, partial [Methylophilaceae bacterium]|nr:chemotaxis protein CheW [Methylophilaceae bacterium]
RAIMLLSFNQILEKEFVAGERQQSYQLAANVDEASTNSDFQDIRLITFTAEDQEYAFLIERVEEIIFLPKMLQIPNVEATVAGVIQLRERLLPVFYLRALLSLPPSEASPQNRIIVVPVKLEAGSQLVGLVVDTVKEIIQVPENKLEQVPQFFGFDSANAEISAICRIPEQDRLISVLSSEAMFGIQKVQDLLHGLQDKTKADDETVVNTVQDEIQLVVFKLLEDELALPVEVVQEIVRVPELAPVPQAPEFIAGVFNYRGVVTPVVNQRRRLGFPSAPDLESQRIMVLDVQGIKTGFMVDSITEVVRVSAAALENTPDLFQSHLRMVQKIVHLGPDRMILMLDTEQLLNSVEFKALTKAAKKEKTR